MPDQDLDNKYLPDRSRVLIKGSTKRGTVYEYEMSLEQLFQLYSLPSSESINATTDTVYTNPEGSLIEKVLIDPEEDLNDVRFGTTPGGDEIYPSSVVKAEDSSTGLFEINFYSSKSSGPRNLYISGITSNTIIKLYKR